jgi:hypothetical protein
MPASTDPHTSPPTTPCPLLSPQTRRRKVTRPPNGGDTALRDERVFLRLRMFFGLDDVLGQDNSPSRVMRDLEGNHADRKARDGELRALTLP